MATKYFSILLNLSCVVSCVIAVGAEGLSAYGESPGVQPDDTTPTAITGSANCADDCFVSGGSRSGNNLFHSFRTFSIPENATVTFTGEGAANIFARVSGEASQIDGTLAVTEGANFFLINPHGVTFGSQALLLSTGSFVASTADSIVFSDGVFSTTQSNSPLLTVSAPIGLPIGLRFGDRPGAIVNRSQATSVGSEGNSLGSSSGLRVDLGKTLALVGGFVHLAGGNLTASGGQIAIGSVASGSEVSLSPDLVLGYEGGSTFQDIQLTGDAFVDASGEGGQISLRGRNLTLADQSIITNFNAGLTAGTIHLSATEAINITGVGILFSPLSGSANNGADLNIVAKNLTLRAGAIISGGTFDGGRGGNVVINASESVELAGTGRFSPSLITTATEGTGAGGDITINTRRLAVRGGAQLQAVTYGEGRGGDLTVNASERIEVNGAGSTAFDPQIASGILASSGVAGLPFRPTGNGGNLRLNTGILSIGEGAVVAVNSLGRGDAGNLEVNARAVRLSGRAQLTAAAAFGNGGNIRLAGLETLVLRQGSVISARAGTGDGRGNGGNININAGFIVTNPLEDSDIIARASQGRGGNIAINTRGVYGIAERRAVPNNGTNDIDGTSDFGESGLIAVSQLTTEADRRLGGLPLQPFETAAKVSQGCAATGDRFIVTGRGGLPAVPTDAAEISAPLVDLGGRFWHSDSPAQNPLEKDSSEEPQILDANGEAAWVEANSWTRDRNNQVVLSAASFQSAFSPQPAANCTG